MGESAWHVSVPKPSVTFIHFTRRTMTEIRILERMPVNQVQFLSIIK